MSAAAVVIGALRVKTTKCTKAIKNMLSHFFTENRVWHFNEQNIKPF